MKRLHLNANDTLILSDVLIPPKFVRWFAPRVSRVRPATRTTAPAPRAVVESSEAATATAAEATTPYSLWKETLAETERPTPLLLRACGALLGASVAGAIGYGVLSVHGLFHADALDRAVRVFLFW